MNETTYINGLVAEPSQSDYKAEGDVIIENLKNNAAYCNMFFFDRTKTDNKGKQKKKLCQIASLRSKMIFDMKKDFGVEINPDDFSTIVYTALWNGGTWSALDSFSGRSSFFVWLRKVAKHAIMEWLIEERLIDDVSSRTIGNTRLALLSQSTETCKMVIDDLMAGSKYHGLLTAIYVDRLPKEAIMDRMSMTDDEYETAKKKGENKLKDALLRTTTYSEEDLIRDKKTPVVLVSDGFAAELSEWCRDKTGVNPFSDVFGTNLTDEEVRVKTVEFLYDFSAKLKWSEQDRYIWQRRFIINADPVGLAFEVGRDRGWLDTRYSRLNKKFEKAIQKWWKSHVS